MEGTDKDRVFKEVREAITSGKITTVEELYRYVPIKVVGESLGYNPVSFSNRKARDFGSFSISDIGKLASIIGLPIEMVMAIFIASFQSKN